MYEASCASFVGWMQNGLFACLATCIYTYVRVALYIRTCRATHTFVWAYTYVRVNTRIRACLAMEYYVAIYYYFCAKRVEMKQEKSGRGLSFFYKTGFSVRLGVDLSAGRLLSSGLPRGILSDADIPRY